VGGSLGPGLASGAASFVAVAPELLATCLALVGGRRDTVSAAQTSTLWGGLEIQLIDPARSELAGRLSFGRLLLLAGTRVAGVHFVAQLATLVSGRLVANDRLDEL